MQAIARSSHVSNATLQHDYYHIYGKRVQLYSIRLRQIVSAEELKRSLEYGTSLISRVIVIRRESMYLVFLERSTLLSFWLIIYVWGIRSLIVHINIVVTEFSSWTPHVSISEFCSCCDGAAIELSASLFKTIESCTGSHEAPIACTCLNGSSQVTN